MAITKEEFDQFRAIIREEVISVVRDEVPPIIRDEVQSQLTPILARLDAIEARLDRFWTTYKEDVDLALKIATQAQEDVKRLKKRITQLEAAQA